MSPRAVVGFLALACLGLAALGLALGSTGLRPAAIGELLRGDVVVAELRAPRVALAALIGASLAIAGVAMQTLLCNDLADPYVLGVSGGASLGAVLALAVAPALPVAAAAVAGGALALSLVRALATPEQPTRLLLTGVTVGAVFASVTALLLVTAPHATQVRSATFWLFGGLGTPRWPWLLMPLAILAVTFAWLLGNARRLDRLVLGDDLAACLGVPVRTVRRRALAAALAATAAAVAAAGLIGFVGLLAPHLARRLVGGSHRRLLPAAALLGASLLIAADIAARTMLAPRELPVGSITALVGGPVFLVLLGRKEVDA